MFGNTGTGYSPYQPAPQGGTAPSAAGSPFNASSQQQLDQLNQEIVLFAQALQSLGDAIVPLLGGT